ncbi:MAG: hypothetical protein ACK5IH_10100, partial [Betaproteobacteria bacterium]
MHAGPLDDGPPRRAFADSRRLVGANRWYAGPAVTLVPLGPAAADGAAQGRWIAHVVSACAALGWPGPDPRVHLHPGGQLLVFAAPADALRAAAGPSGTSVTAGPAYQRLAPTSRRESAKARRGGP